MLVCVFLCVCCVWGNKCKDSIKNRTSSKFFSFRTPHLVSFNESCYLIMPGNFNIFDQEPCITGNDKKRDWDIYLIRFARIESGSDMAWLL